MPSFSFFGTTEDAKKTCKDMQKSEKEQKEKEKEELKELTLHAHNGIPVPVPKMKKRRVDVAPSALLVCRSIQQQESLLWTVCHRS